MAAQSPSAPASPVPVFPAAPLPIYFLGAAVSGFCLAGRGDKKKADPKTSLKVFRRGCLKGRSLFGQIALRCKCEEPKDDCTKRNQPWKSAISAGQGMFYDPTKAQTATQNPVSERNGQ